MARQAESGSVEERKRAPVRRVLREDAVDYASTGAEECVDTSSEDSFPASDPPAFTPISHTGRPRKGLVRQKPQ